MIINMRKRIKYLPDNRGFTLIEMAIVLIIIGIIIGAVLKGKDLIRSAEQKKIYTKYVNAWRISYASFYDRTGKRLGDFWDASLGTPGQGQDSKCDTASTDGTTINNTQRGYLKTGDSSGTDFRGLDTVGLTAPTTNTGNSWEYKYTDSDGTGHDVSVAFKYDSTGKYNYMWLDEIPNELGMALDTMMDGEADGTTGDFLCYNTADNTNADWGVPATEVSARWKMDF